MKEYFMSDQIILKVNGQEITMVPFVQKILINSIEAVTKELNGCPENGDIEISIKKQQ
jgi:molybdopterin-guanine dinucleotide biosynthesis protein B